ncbi:serine palmitoyl CoA transferase subunit LcbA [Conidiobolus coronatus NRRL 28638]|uniref:serine C-palmitoyltransferase n=1 Tax=Conidiobolus coronatus (strain ATCC 28846 / CBS 209.66 / NRRL 28638) TaxID=796925 RepID=A0A137P175_CONC2|nr:serine palmitoyl CoA transferase subunit LcbA [Conidiobolus coronatus NRRL 28638]|eukprot:KXN68820.1 serine palmitoyl CoA transferase subunit LcbA [Conidiobolus coronatus NRRL 28638]
MIDYSSYNPNIFNRIIIQCAEWTSFVPGSQAVWKYVLDSHQDDPFRVLMEIILIFFALHYVMSKSYKVNDKEKVKLTEKEIDELVADWQPEPLVSGELSEWDRLELDSSKVFSGPTGAKQTTKEGKVLLNAASANFLGLNNNDQVREKAVEVLREYGVGTCGPCGFYGTIDKHMDLEKNLSTFLGYQESILYSHGFSTVSSVIPCFCKRGDLIICDENVNFAIQKGVQISRSSVKYFKHNDMKDLERILKEVETEDLKTKRLPPRRFIIVEGLYQNSGDIAPMPTLIEFKKKYKYRLLSDESYSFGVLGANGRGSAEHFNLKTTDIDVYVATLSNALSAAGGFCASTPEIIERQRLAGAAYVFSASMPAILTHTAIESLNMLEQNPALLSNLRSNIRAAKSILNTIPHYDFTVSSHTEHSPIIHLAFSKEISSKVTLFQNATILQEIVDECFKEGVLITRSKYHPTQERRQWPPSIRFALTAGLSVKESERCASVVKSSTQKVLNQHKLL